MSAGQKPASSAPGMAEVRTMLVWHRPTHVSPQEWRQGRVEGRTLTNLRYLFPQWWNSLCFQWQILFPSSAQWCSFLCMEALSSPSPEIYYFTNPNMSEIVLHLHFKPDKIIFRVTFFPWRQLQIEYFLPCYLSLPLFPGQLHFETANHSVLRERPPSPAAIFSSPVCRSRLCISHPGPSLTENLLQALGNIFTAHISQVGCCLCWMLVEWGGSSYAPGEGKAERSIPVYLERCVFPPWPLLLVSFATKETELAATTSAWEISLWEAVAVAYIQHLQKGTRN